MRDREATFDYQRFAHSNYITSSRFSRFMSDEVALWGFGSCCCIGLILCGILLPISFGAIAEEQLGFRKARISGRVNFDKLFHPGYHHNGPNNIFSKVSRHIHTVEVRRSNAWTCPEDSDTGDCKQNPNSQEVGQTVYTTCTVNFRITPTKEAVRLAYEKYQFDDGRVRQQVISLATENSKETPQNYTAGQIFASVTDEKPQVVVDVQHLGDEISSFGYELVDVVVEEINMDEAAQAKFLLQDLKRYDDDLVKKQWLATNEKQITEQEVTEIGNLQVQEVRAIEAEVVALKTRLSSDLEAYRRKVDVDSTLYLIDMFKEVFPDVGDMDIAELAATTMYMDQLTSVGSSDDVETVFMGGESNRLFTQSIS